MKKYKYSRDYITSCIGTAVGWIFISDIKKKLLAKEQGECKHNWVTSYITPTGTGYECSKCGVEKGQEKSPPLKEDRKEIEKLTNDDFDGSSDHDAINFLWEWNIEMQKKINQLIDAINHLSSKE